MLLHLWRYEVFVRSLIKTKGHGYINLRTKVSIVRRPSARLPAPSDSESKHHGSVPLAVCLA